jgi:hypothetical protein
MSARAIASVAMGLMAIAGAARAGAAGSPVTIDVRSSMGFALLAETEEPELLIAQRVITRAWGHASDSIYTTIQVPDWRSEGGAMAMSAILPGAGELYAGERSGYLFLLAEAMGWTAFVWMDRTADDRREDARHWAGPPDSENSKWSFERWSDATDADATELMQLYEADPNAFYERIRDPAYRAGWLDAEGDVFNRIQNSADRRRRIARLAIAGLCVNHLVSAVDAFRAARIHNLPLWRNLELRVQPELGFEGGAGLTATLAGNF